ncbi:MAG TPA: c-type cytochrome [Pirellulales bacterium]|jgi:mono/diheme cytochrome c family protein
MNVNSRTLPDSRRIIGLCCALAAVALAVMALAGCGRREALKHFERPGEIRDFVKLFAQNCSGCHGADGKFGPAPPLNDSLFLAIIPDAEFTRVVSQGRTSTLMPAFSRGSGGTLTDEQIAILVRGVRSKWGKADVADAASLPAYVAPGDAAEGQSSKNHETALQLFGLACGNCHGAQGQGGKEAGALHDAAFLSLISDQALRRIVITGRADLGMPDFRRLGAMLPDGKPLSNQQIAEVVALLASWRHPMDSHKEPTDQAGGL